MARKSGSDIKGQKQSTEHAEIMALATTARKAENTAT